jgi:hypothetical protein
VLSRRALLCGASILVATQAIAWTHGANIPLDNIIPVSSLSLGSHSANAFAGFTSPATTVSSSGGMGVTDKVINPNPDNDVLVCQSTQVWRDYQVTTYTGRGAIYLRVAGANGSQTGFVFAYNGAVTGGDIRVGIVTGMDTTSTSVPYLGGTPYLYYVNTNVAASAEGIAAGFTNTWAHGNNFTFGVDGFTVYLQWNGNDLIRYTEWRLMQSGTTAVWTHDAYGATDITVRYFSTQSLFSIPSANIFDPRDFGMRNVAAVTGSITGGTSSLVLNSASTFQIGDQIIVEIGGEAGAGARGTKGVGGTWPALNYANTTAMNADTSQAVGTFAYDASSNPLAVYAWNGSSWTHTQNGGGGGYTAQSYYTYLVNPLSLVAKVTAVSGDKKTLTLSINAAVTATNANVWLDCLPSFFVLNQVPPVGAVLVAAPNNITLSIPSSQSTGDAAWQLSGIITNGALPNCVTADLVIQGAGRTLTTLRSPSGCTSAAFNIGGVSTNGVQISDFAYVGNSGANGAGFAFGPNTFISMPIAISIVSLSTNTGLVIKNIDGTNPIAQLAVVNNGSSPSIANCTTTVKVQQYDYVQWQFQLANCTGGSISGCTATGTFILKAFEVFACNSSKIVNCGGQNCEYSTNSSTSWTIDFGSGQTTTAIFTTNCWANQLSGAIDEAVINVNDNAFGSGSTGLVNNPNIIQQGYIDASNNSLKFIQISSLQTNVTVQGEYPGGGGCSTTLGGLMQAPNYNGGSAEYGAMAVLSDAASTIVNGIRIKGSAIGTPGHSGHFGNISLGGASSQVNNCVADVIQTGPALSGNQTNAAYGGC